MSASRSAVRSCRTISGFSGIGGLDYGLEQGGCEILAQCESWEPARRVLADRWPDLEVHPDITTADFDVDDVDLLAAGFPCTDISHAGSKAGISGPQSGLVDHVFRLAEVHHPRWILLENVPNLLVLQRASGIRYLTSRLELLGYRWAYRVVDARFTGLPQRRHRVLLLAGRGYADPAAVLFGDDAGVPDEIAHPPSDHRASGFYWTEGRHGVGLVAGAIPTLKGGSTIGLPSAPAIWFPGNSLGRRFLLPGVEDGEALQGLPRGWTRAAVGEGERDQRWKLIGNAVPPAIGRWVAQRLVTAPDRTTAAVWCGDDKAAGQTFDRNAGRWPDAAWGTNRQMWRVAATRWPLQENLLPLTDFVDAHDVKALSHRATTGFLRRLDESRLPVPAPFYADLEEHQSVTRPPLATNKNRWDGGASTRARMSRQAQRDTKPELLLRRHLYALGLRYRLQYRPIRDLRRRLDIVFTSARVAVDVRGCFWHACPLHGTRSGMNADRWSTKLERTAERDANTADLLVAHGWTVVVVWEHDDLAKAARRIATIVAGQGVRTKPARIVYAGGFAGVRTQR
ncbi:DNA mismatch endonuclease Vsr [Mycobacteroides chelonae]|uniref:DNA mismatch endonuclease Vsr n=1 Tax=Mycobacteroides chelonae TaxID=1774 RepID=UPI0013F4E304|nr:DNA mismatch endonuclease Vsr [Mycobacteroides chelonae]MBF9328598.1 DNA mismatch endonuclease Vsr [Mycobacteroides chelonae]MBF9435156.1 DNA mismatch endonuclease Vsr [Mycobacteroides chelonae]MBV6362513.1 DNA mismatch endonuclease Vsr [Mycobacteroides chelonae]MEC4836762.1 DNA mismatch endonuclease Vsr [Mycobacteroides chelonae]MEC4854230.1 DNA mismatch endonuclease Vsr [Mycobacteroides chelonae]